MKHTHKQEIESAWNAFFEASKVDNIEELHAEGWMTIQDYVDASNAKGIPVDARRAKHLLTTNANLEKKTVTIAQDDGQARRVNVYRPKVGRKQK